MGLLDSAYWSLIALMNFYSACSSLIDAKTEKRKKKSIHGHSSKGCIDVNNI
uniref:Uncharacterized protein n=1 Tax=Rhizophora mucronata TaxID=61149 RepID=A0A2P2QIA0_RHIMU